MNDQENIEPDYGITFGEFDFGEMEFDATFLADNDNRYHNPVKHHRVKQKNVMYAYAVDAAKNIKITDGLRSHMITAGSFEFGDFLEAFFVENNIHTDKLSISTLSMSNNNVDSLNNLMRGGYVDQLELIVSDFFFAHERRGLVPYILQELDWEDRFQLAVAGSHTKITIFETSGGKKMCIHGSSNLRSSGCVEQTTIEDNPELYEFYAQYHKSIIDQYNLINKPIRNKKLWQVVQQNGQPTTTWGSPEENQQQATDALSTARQTYRSKN